MREVYEVPSSSTDQFEEKKILNFLDKVKNGAIKPNLPQSYELMHLSKYAEHHDLTRALQSPELTLLKLYKHNCRGCKISEPGFEKLAFDINRAKEELEKPDFDIRYNSVSSRLGITQIENFKKLQLLRFNTENNVKKYLIRPMLLIRVELLCISF